jgi:hypothetical protein
MQDLQTYDNSEARSFGFAYGLLVGTALGAPWRCCSHQSPDRSCAGSSQTPHLAYPPAWRSGL